MINDGEITPAAVTSIGDIAGVAKVGNELTVRATIPNTATVTYQWQIESAPATWTDILSATSNKYTVQGGDAGKNLRVVATGTGNYEGIVTSASFKILN